MMLGVRQGPLCRMAVLSKRQSIKRQLAEADIRLPPRGRTRRNRPGRAEKRLQGPARPRQCAVNQFILCY